MRIQNKDLSNAIRVLSIDAVEKANSGHPGMPMGMADVATVLFKNFLKFNPSNPSWINRDRFVLSAGHGSMLLYSLLYLTGYKSISISDIKNFRQLNSICAGHPEFEKNSGIETTTGPLGQGIANAVGFAIAEEVLKKKLGSKIINHKTYVLAGDGCLMEGISHEAMSLAGHLKLKNLIMLFDNNSISIDGPTSLAVSDNYKKRFESYGWNYIDIDGHNEKQIYSAIKRAHKTVKPTVISCKTKIGFGSPNKSGKASSHGSPLGLKEIELVRQKLKWPYKPFEIPKKVLNEWRKIGLKGSKTEVKWKKIFSRNKKDLKDLFKNNFSKSILKQKKDVITSLKPLATRKSSEAVLNSLFEFKNNLIGGSADLAGSNNTKSKFNKVINANNFDGDYIHYGVREHAMCGIMNGLALHSNLIPYGGTFLIFSDYCKPSIRLSALMKQRVIYVMTHDSIGLGEDGPTHQPIEQLSGLRSIPNLNILRPADQTETIECWDIALKNSKTPSVLALTRQNLDPIRKRFTSVNKCSSGAYEVMRTNKKIKLTILATGSEVNMALNISHKLAKEKIYSKVISMPCQEIFDDQSLKYKNKILNETSKIFSIEAGSDQSWSKYINNKGISFSINDFGKSAPYKKVYDHFGLNVEKICKKIKSNIKKMPIKIGINGMGRIGRMVVRSIYENHKGKIQIKHINNRSSSEVCMNLLKYDSVHGKFRADIKHNANYLKINNDKISFSQFPNIQDINWKKYNVDYVFECTGKFNSKEKLISHLKNGAKKVIVSAPCKNADKTVVFGVNQKKIQKNDNIISTASCTTNCLAPIADVINKNFTIQHGFMTTIHAFTTDQRILDNSHKDPRRARSASQSIIPTSTGASKAIGEIIPSLKGKLGGVAMRVPTPNVSLVEFVFNVKKNISKEKLNSSFSKASNAYLKNILDVTKEKLVSIDFNHNSASAILDSSLTNVVGSKMGKISAWYDNEWGFSNRMCDIARYLSKIN